MNLYQLSGNIEQVLFLMEDGTEGLEDTLEALDMAFEEKVENIVKLYRNKKAEADAIKAEEQRLADRRKKLEGDAEWLKGYTEMQMKRLGRDEVKSLLFKIKLANNPPSVNVIDETIVPSDYWREKVDRSIDKKTVLELLKSGQAIPGVEIKQERSLRIG